MQRYRCKLANHHELLVDLRDPMAAPYFFNGGLEHESGTATLLERALSPGAVFVDVGANLGYFSAMAARLVGATGRVLALEPLPKALSLLRENVAPYPWVDVVAAAAGHERGSAAFSSMPSGDLSGLGVRQGADRVLTVPVTTIDDITKDLERLDLLKIDVEGQEAAVLAGARRSLRRFRPLVYLEAHDGGRSTEPILKEVGYRWAAHGEQQAYSPDESVNRLALPTPV